MSLAKANFDYVKFYMNNHKQIPYLDYVQSCKFLSTFRDIMLVSKMDVSHSLCEPYGFNRLLMDIPM